MLQDADSRLAPPPVRLLAAVCVALLVLQPAAGQENTLTNADVQSLTRAGVPAEEIVVRIGSDNADLDTSFESLMALSRGGVSPAVLEAMSRAEVLARPAELDRYVRELARQAEVARLGPGGVFSDPLRSGGSGPDLVVVPSGSFRMGCVSGVGCDGDEKPVHQVTIPVALAVGRYEVTFSEWDACASAGGCGHRPDDSWGRGDQSVRKVSWDDAQEYVTWLSLETGVEYRLLSESEWEYAARAGSATAYSWGNAIGSGRASWGDGRTTPVGSFPPNAFGLYDMHGNVWEWVEDCWNGRYDGAPADGRAWRSGNCSRRVLRGGSWSDPPRYLRSAFRYEFPTGDRSLSFGFRVVRTLTP